MWSFGPGTQIGPVGRWSAKDDLFATSVKISPDASTIVLGATQSAAGFVFPGSGTPAPATPQLQQPTGDGYYGDYFASSVSISSDNAYIAVGAPCKTPTPSGGPAQPPNATGVVYVFKNNGDGTWSLVAILTASDGAPGDFFGTSVDLDGNPSLGYPYTLVVGAPGQNGNAGAVYVYVLQGTTWVQQKLSISPAPVANTFFGRAVALTMPSVAGTTPNLLVGAPGYNNNAGLVYIYQAGGTGWTTWSQSSATLAAPTPTAGDNFGADVGLSSNGGTRYNAIVGTRSSTGTREYAYIFRIRPTSVSALAVLTPSGIHPPSYNTPTSPASYFGYSVSISPSGGTAVVGACHTTYTDPGTGYQYPGVGAAYAFGPTTNWSPSTTLVSKLSVAPPPLPPAANAVNPNQRLGFAVAVTVAHSRATAVVGAPFRNQLSPTSTGGQAFIFTGT